MQFYVDFFEKIKQWRKILKNSEKKEMFLFQLENNNPLSKEPKKRHE